MDQKITDIDNAFWGTFYSRWNMSMEVEFPNVGVRAPKEKNQQILRMFQLEFRPEIIEKYAEEGLSTLPNYIHHPIRDHIMDIYNVDERKADELTELIFQLGNEEYESTVEVLKGLAFGDFETSLGREIKRKELEGKNPYLAISRSRDQNIRGKMQNLSEADIYYALAKHSMASFGLEQRDFSLTNNQMINAFSLENYVGINISELFAYALLGDPKLIVMHAAIHPKATKALVDDFFKKRYYMDKGSQLDAFDGFIPSPDFQERFKECYAKLPEIFANLDVSKEDIAGKKPVL